MFSALPDLLQTKAVHFRISYDRRRGIAQAPKSVKRTSTLDSASRYSSDALTEAIELANTSAVGTDGDTTSISILFLSFLSVTTGDLSADSCRVPSGADPSPFVKLAAA